jgi:cytochrome P450
MQSAAPLDVESPGVPWFDETFQVWMVSRYADVGAGLQDGRLAAGESETEWHRTYRESAIETFSGDEAGSRLREVENHARALLANRLEPFDIVEDYAKPFCCRVADHFCGFSGSAALTDAEEIFASAAEPFDAALRDCSGEATRRLVATSTPLSVQAFVAMTQSVPAFLANSVYALSEHSARTVFASAAIEELLRYAGPAKVQLRDAREDVQLGGIRIQKGQRVALMLASANRDPEAFADPDRLDLTRAPNKHVAFGSGPHSCLGAALVRATSTVALRTLFEVFPDLCIESWRDRDRFAIRAIEYLQASPSTSPHHGPR